MLEPVEGYSGLAVLCLRKDSMRAMILAAGLGTRLRPLTLVRPKVLAPIAGVSVLDFWVTQLYLAGFEAVVINSFHLSEALTAEVQNRRWAIPVHVRVEPVLLGTGGGIRNVEDFFDGEPFAVINGDTICKVDWEAILAQYDRSDGPAGLLIHDCPAFNNVAVDENGHILGFGNEAFELKRARGDIRLMAFTGIHLMRPEILADVPPGQPGEILAIYRKLILEGQPPRELHSPEIFWREMGSVESYKGLHAEFPRLGEGFLPPLATGRRTWIQETANIASDAVLKGYVSVGEGSRVMGGCELENVIVWDRVCIEPGSCLCDCIITDGVAVGGIHRGEVIVNDRH